MPTYSYYLESACNSSRIVRHTVSSKQHQLTFAFAYADIPLLWKTELPSPLFPTVPFQLTINVFVFAYADTFQIIAIMLDSWPVPAMFAFTYVGICIRKYTMKDNDPLAACPPYRFSSIPLILSGLSHICFCLCFCICRHKHLLSSCVAKDCDVMGMTVFSSCQNTFYFDWVSPWGCTRSRSPTTACCFIRCQCIPIQFAYADISLLWKKEFPSPLFPTVPSQLTINDFAYAVISIYIHERKILPSR